MYVVYAFNNKTTRKHINHSIKYRLDQIKEASYLHKTYYIYTYIGRNCMQQFSRGLDIQTLVSDIKILCTVDQDVFTVKLS